MYLLIFLNSGCRGLNKTIAVPVKLGAITINATLYVLDTKHIDMIIGCDLLNMLRARIYFKSKQFLFLMQKSILYDKITLSPPKIFFPNSVLNII